MVSKIYDHLWVGSSYPESVWPCVMFSSFTEDDDVFEEVDCIRHGINVIVPTINRASKILRHMGKSLDEIGDLTKAALRGETEHE